MLQGLRFFTSLGLRLGVIAALAACGSAADEKTSSRGLSPYAGVLWEAAALNEEITGCRARQEARLGSSEAARIYCKCVYIGLSKLSSYEQFAADKNATSQQFEQGNGIKDCQTWVETKRRIDQETENHGLYYRRQDGEWVDMFTGKQYPHHEIFY